MESSAGPDGPRFLVVDDALTTTNAARLLLEAEGVEHDHVREAFSGIEALEAFREEGADVVILALGLPDIGGDALVERLRAIDPDVRVVALTGFRPEDPRVLRALASGAHHVIQKPLRRSHTRTIVDLSTEADLFAGGRRHPPPGGPETAEGLS